MKILIADDHTLFRESLRGPLSSRGFELLVGLPMPGLDGSVAPPGPVETK